MAPLLYAFRIEKIQPRGEGRSNRRIGEREEEEEAEDEDEGEEGRPVGCKHRVRLT